MPTVPAQTSQTGSERGLCQSWNQFYFQFKKKVWPVLLGALAHKEALYVIELLKMEL